jgi:hypothetical protein
MNYQNGYYFSPVYTGYRTRQCEQIGALQNQFDAIAQQIRSMNLDNSGNSLGHNLMMLMEIIHERLCRVEETGLIERLRKAEVMR